MVMELQRAKNRCVQVAIIANCARLLSTCEEPLYQHSDENTFDDDASN
jgi:hypothetical protein